jgi:hypothetical protein
MQVLFTIVIHTQVIYPNCQFTVQFTLLIMHSGTHLYPQQGSSITYEACLRHEFMVNYRELKPLMLRLWLYVMVTCCYDRHNDFL